MGGGRKATSVLANYEIASLAANAMVGASELDFFPEEDRAKTQRRAFAEASC